MIDHGINTHGYVMYDKQQLEGQTIIMIACNRIHCLFRSQF